MLNTLLNITVIIALRAPCRKVVNKVLMGSLLERDKKIVTETQYIGHREGFSICWHNYCSRNLLLPLLWSFSNYIAKFGARTTVTVTTWCSVNSWLLQLGRRSQSRFQLSGNVTKLRKIFFQFLWGIKSCQ